MQYVDINTAFNIHFTLRTVQWSKWAQAVYALYNKAGMVLRGRMHLATPTIPNVIGNMMTGTGHPKVGLVCPSTNKGHTNESPLNGGSSPTSAVR